MAIMASEYLRLLPQGEKWGAGGWERQNGERLNELLFLEIPKVVYIR